MAVDPRNLRALFTFAAQNSVSDIHFRVGSPPAFRMKGDLVNVKSPAYSDSDMLEVCRLIMTDPAESFEASPKPPIETRIADIHELDGSYEIPGLCRFRFNVFRQDGHLGAVLRIIPNQIPTLASLGMPAIIRKLAEAERGLILVTGATGTGKSTTLAAMVDHLNSSRNGHIVTIEDPVEFIHPQKKSRVTQREVGRDTSSFAAALRAALRQDPDVILLGEMRDAETIDIALKAAETGHTVLSTVHTLDAAKSISRLVSMFAAEEQQMVRLRLAECLKGTISQRLLKRIDGKGRVIAQEIMVVNSVIQECIVDARRTADLNQFIENADLLGAQTFQQHLARLYREGVISLDEAKLASSNPADFERNLRYEDASSGRQQGTHSIAIQRPGPAFGHDDATKVVLDEQPGLNARGARRG